MPSAGSTLVNEFLPFEGGFCRPKRQRKTPLVGGVVLDRWQVARPLLSEIRMELGKLNGGNGAIQCGAVDGLGEVPNGPPKFIRDIERL